MSRRAVRAALETALESITPTMPTAWENSGYKPVVGTPYQTAEIIWSTPDDGELGGTTFMQAGYLQVILRYPPGQGSAAAITRTEALEDLFTKAATFTKDGIATTIERVARVLTAFTDKDDRYAVPVRIPFNATLAI